MLQRLEQLRALAPWERRMLARLVFLLPAVDASLRLLGFKRSRDLLARSAPLSTVPNRLVDLSGAETAQRIARLVGIAARHGLYRTTCLRQSLTLWWLLRRRGIPSELRIGVRKDGVGLDAHAWVEHCGATLGQESPDYRPFTDLRVT